MILVKITLVILILVSILINQNYGERSFEILVNSYNCSVNTNYAIAHVCYLNKTFNPARAYFDIQIQREIPILTYSWVLYLLKPNSNKRRRLLDVHNMNACEFLQGNSAIPFLKIFRNIMLEYGTMPMKCPISKDSRFLFNDLIIDSEKFPPYLPETQFVITVNLTTGKNFVFLCTADGKVMQKSNINH